jgi:predicted enzyme related to lactoylglutathione lyase
MSMKSVPAGSGKHPILFVAISANELQASMTFYSKVFKWHTHQVTPTVAGAATPGGPNVALRADSPAGFPPLVPFIGVEDVDAMLTRVASAGGSIDRAPWPVPGAGMLGRFKDPSGTIYGLTTGLPGGPIPRIEMPFGTNPKPVPGVICSLEMYAKDGEATGRFFEELFGWGSIETMPSFRAFDPGAGIGGVFQTHTPATPAVGYIYAEDVKATLSEIESGGGKRIGEPMSAPGMGTFGYFLDASGSTLGLIGP